MRRGFTLIELLIVMAILGVMMAIIVPSFQMMPSTQIAMAAKDSLRIMRYAHNMALQTQQPITVTFSPGTITLASPFDKQQTKKATETPADESHLPKEQTTANLPNQVETDGLDSVGLVKRYKEVDFEFLEYKDSVAVRRSTSGKAEDIHRRAPGQSASPILGFDEETEGETFSITVRANGTTRPFAFRIYERGKEGVGGDVVTFDFLCSGTISVDE